MKKIKSFIYLDDQKIKSIASQIFEGVVQSYVNHEENEETKTEEQKGAIGSGHMLGDILKTKTIVNENRFLHDYFYNMLEIKLEELGKVNSTNNLTLNEIANLETFTFIKVKGKAIFNDSREIIKTLSQFNELSETMAYMDLADTLKTVNTKKGKQDLINKYKKENDLDIPDEFIKKMIFATNFGLNDMFEVQIEKDSFNFTSSLNRKNLTEDEQYLINKFSRVTEGEITLFGIITQSCNYQSSSQEEIEIENFKDGFRNIINSLVDVEHVFTGKNIGEFVIDPIAIYAEL